MIERCLPDRPDLVNVDRIGACHGAWYPLSWTSGLSLIVAARGLTLADLAGLDGDRQAPDSVKDGVIAS